MNNQFKFPSRFLFLSSTSHHDPEANENMCMWGGEGELKRNPGFESYV